MARNNADFQSGRAGIVEAFHVSPKSNRRSIEKNGLIPGEAYTDSSKRKANSGVFGATKAKGVEQHAHYADNRPAFDSEGNFLINQGPHEGGDIWKFAVPAERVEPDTWTTPRGSSVKHAGTIHPKYLTRVGHITGDNEVHWHPEESCHG